MEIRHCKDGVLLNFLGPQFLKNTLCHYRFLLVVANLDSKAEGDATQHRRIKTTIPLASTTATRTMFAQRQLLERVSIVLSRISREKSSLREDFGPIFRTRSVTMRKCQHHQVMRKTVGMVLEKQSTYSCIQVNILWIISFLVQVTFKYFHKELKWNEP
jgi:hypothetical protein